jgi:type II secretory pathway component GspD/PulD (secretin)
MKKLLLLPLLVVVCLAGDTSKRLLATTAGTVTESTPANISTRALVQTGDNVVIGGFP